MERHDGAGGPTASMARVFAVGVVVLAARVVFAVGVVVLAVCVAVFAARVVVLAARVAGWSPASMMARCVGSAAGAGAAAARVGVLAVGFAVFPAFDAVCRPRRGGCRLRRAVAGTSLRARFRRWRNRIDAAGWRAK
ncbi:hypothetical protein [Amycolatopsis arida]|uniref:hypothetical protein n=1 Tax=Amycolatopsis arida TaxID=587909 RepID=UPI0010650622|nr:hypothetical protein [Amycolatopsis arida]